VKPTLVACWLALSTAACSGAADIPETPDLRELLSSYERPTASLDVTSVVDALSSVPQLKEIAAGIQAAAYVMDNVSYASRTSSAKGGERVRLQGSLGLKVLCPGDRSDPKYDESVNGSLSITLAVAENRIRRSMRGHANACIRQGTVRDFPVRIKLDGDVAFDVGGDIGIGQPWSGELLAFLPGELSVGEYVFRSVSGRLHEGRIQYLAQTDRGSLVFELSEQGITIRDASGVWFCAEGESCTKQ